MITKRWGAYHVPLLEKPEVWGRGINREDLDVLVAQPYHIKEEVSRARASLMLKHGWIRGGDYVPYEVCSRVEIAASGATTGSTAQQLILGSSSTALAGSGSNTLGSGGFWYPGRTLRIKFWGTLTTPASPGTIAFDWKVDTVGTGTTGTSLGASAASATLATPITNGSWCIDSFITCRSIGSSGTIFGMGKWQPSAVLFTTQVELFMPSSAPTTTAIDTTSNSFIKFFTTMGATGDSLAIQLGYWEVLN